MLAPILLTLLLLAGSADAEPALTVDLATIGTGEGVLRRVHGSVGVGNRGVPVAGGIDCDQDGFPDYAFAAMQATTLGKTQAGSVFLVFGDGTLAGTLDTATPSAEILEIAGAAANENAGSEIWIDDVTGDGIGDLLIARQNFTLDPGGPGERVGAGALTILVGGESLRTFAATLGILDLASPDPSLTLTTFVGAQAFSRLGIWMRTGDVTGDGIPDLVIGADQENGVATHSGAVYVVRGGSHLVANQEIDLESLGSTPLMGHIARVTPPAIPTPSHFHFGATCQVADLDGDGRAEVLAAAALNRSGAALNATGGIGGTAHATGGSPNGTLYIAWGDNFGGASWIPTLDFAVDSVAASSIVDGGTDNLDFGEEILGGLDYDGDGKADLFVGDIMGDLSGQGRTNAGAGHVFYDAAKLKGLVFDLDDLAMQGPAIETVTVHGAAAGHIFADTAAHGDFNGDGIDDLAVSSPHATPLGRISAGTIHVFSGRPGPWPALVDLAALPSPAELVVTEIYGANGSTTGNQGDTLCYSAAAGDLDQDGRIDIITNEMTGDGSGGTPVDVGNLILLSGALLGPTTSVPTISPWGLAALAASLLLLSLASSGRSRG